MKIGQILKIKCSVANSVIDNTIWIILDKNTNMYPLNKRSQECLGYYRFNTSLRKIFNIKCDKMIIL